MTNPTLVIGCPVSRREWIMEHWFNYVELALRVVGYRPDDSLYDVHYMFVGDPSDPTFEIINRRAPNATILAAEEVRPLDRRDWSADRINKMVVLRNLLLNAVREYEPNYFLSLDSDILLHHEAISSLIDAVRGSSLVTPTSWDAAGGKCYMTPLPQGPGVVGSSQVPGTACPSYLMEGRDNQWRRVDADVPSLFGVDCIMAIKMMTPPAYAVDYQVHTQGEDVGWCLAARRAGLRLAWDGRVINKHVMMPEHLHVLDPRCGY